MRMLTVGRSLCVGLSCVTNLSPFLQRRRMAMLVQPPLGSRRFFGSSVLSSGSKPTSDGEKSNNPPRFENGNVDKNVVDNFGAPNGPCITNKASVLAEVDAAVGTNRPPDLEVGVAVCYSCLLCLKECSKHSGKDPNASTNIIPQPGLQTNQFQPSFF